MSYSICHLSLKVKHVHHLPVNLLLFDMAVLVGQERVDK
jgi:hypothetical protein